MASRSSQKKKHPVQSFPDPAASPRFVSTFTSASASKAPARTDFAIGDRSDRDFVGNASSTEYDLADGMQFGEPIKYEHHEQPSEQSAELQPADPLPDDAGFMEPVVIESTTTSGATRGTENAEHVSFPENARFLSPLELKLRDKLLYIARTNPTPLCDLALKLAKPTGGRIHVIDVDHIPPKERRDWMLYVPVIVDNVTQVAHSGKEAIREMRAYLDKFKPAPDQTGRILVSTPPSSGFFASLSAGRQRSAVRTTGSSVIYMDGSEQAARTETMGLPQQDPTQDHPPVSLAEEVFSQMQATVPSSTTTPSAGHEAPRHLPSTINPFDPAYQAAVAAEREARREAQQQQQQQSQRNKEIDLHNRQLIRTPHSMRMPERDRLELLQLLLAHEERERLAGRYIPFHSE